MFSCSLWDDNCGLLPARSSLALLLTKSGKGLNENSNPSRSLLFYLSKILLRAVREPGDSSAFSNSCTFLVKLSLSLSAACRSDSMVARRVLVLSNSNSWERNWNDCNLVHDKSS